MTATLETDMLNDKMARLDASNDAPTSPQTEIERLKDRDQKAGLVQRHVSWGPGAASLSDEERAKVINGVMDDVARQLADTAPVPVSQLVEIADALQALSGMSRADIKEWLVMGDAEKNLRRDIGAAVGMTSMFAEQWLPSGVRRERRERRLANMRAERAAASGPDAAPEAVP